ncbi:MULTISPECIES: MFS transporter [unclassified Paenibacillus]|uniref:MFS transporter n=1 Tax=unclassified Paenibacillus TaxID=185978 RepID=UPI0009A5D44C|nr:MULTISPECIES: MFS transporter [unclassified Paenibacillus]SLJ90467.1 Fucose permease [Paenibacillus sp. RU5A]SOC58997.1 Fucose permease [Paenibacillus sp. RU26A]SOC68048.1 Fucose permease [Paenibacillus sp. RU5M]
MAHLLNSRQIHLWRIAIYFFFALSGFAFASWISRTPTIRDTLGASTTEMGWIIFGLAAGSILGLLSASHLIARYGGRFVMVTGLTVGAIGLGTVGIGGSWLSEGIIVFLGLAIFGFGIGICDVAMNVEGTAVEHAAKKSLLTGFHAAFSVGSFLGAITGSLAIKSDIPVLLHLAFVAIVVVVSVVYLYRIVPVGTGRDNMADIDEPPLTTRERMAVWKEPRTILIGIVVLGMAFAEGSANDWLPIVIVDGYNVTPATGSFAYGLFVAAMTIGRAVGDRLLDRFGRVVVLRASALFAIIGLLIVISGKSYAIAAIGVVLWGLGAAFGFPVGLSAAGDDPRGVAARVGAVTTVGYFAFLVGPPILGVIGESVGLLRALIVVLIGVTVAGLLSYAAKPIGPRAEEAKKGVDLKMDL